MRLFTRTAVFCVVICALTACGEKGASSGSGDSDGECTDLVTSEALPLYDGEFFDSHGHVIPTWPDNVVPKAVSKGELSGYVILGLDNTLALQKKDDKTYANCAWFEVQSGVSDLDGTIASLKDTLDAGARCIGEVSVVHFAAGPKAEEKAFSAVDPFLIAVYDVARERRVPINMHYDYSDNGMADFEAGLKAARDESQSDTSNDAIIIWAHSGDASGTVVAKLLAAHRNLYLDLSSRNPLCSYGGRLVSMDEQRLDDGTLTLKSDWKQVMENYSDRIMVGTDIGPGSRHLDIEKTVAYYRTLLGQINEEAAQKIAYKNARGLFTMPAP